MKKLLFTTLIIVLAFGAFAQDDSRDVKAIKEVIQTAYVEGLQNEGDAEKIDDGFHPEFALLIPDGKKLNRYFIKDWKASVLKRKEEGKLPKTDEQKVNITFDFVDVIGTAATAKIKFFVGKELVYYDYISLYKYGREWKIVSKIYYKVEE